MSNDLTGEPPPVLTVAQAQAAARVLKALADPVRLRLVSLILAQGQARAGDLGAAFDLAQPTITLHLNVLFDAGLLVRTREDTGVLYRANPSPLAETAASITPASAVPPPAHWALPSEGKALPG